MCIYIFSTHIVHIRRPDIQATVGDLEPSNKWLAKRQVSNWVWCKIGYP